MTPALFELNKSRPFERADEFDSINLASMRSAASWINTPTRAAAGVNTAARIKTSNC